VLRLAGGAWRLPPGALAPRGARSYARAELRALARAARAHGVDVVPEVALPAGARALLAARPRLGCRAAGAPAGRLCLGSARALALAQAVLGEAAELFGARFVSIGSLAAAATGARDCARCRRRMAEQGLASDTALLAWFVEALRANLSARGATLVLRDPPPGMRLHPSVIAVSAQGTPGQRSVLAPPDLDFSAAQLQNDRFPSSPGLVSLRRVYAFDPDRRSPPAVLNCTIGVQAALWTDFVRDAEQLLYKVSPRICALAEIGWTPRAFRDWGRFHAALKDAHYERLGRDGARPASMDPYPFAVWTAEDISTEWAAIGWNATGAFPSAGHFVVQLHWTYGDSVEFRNVGVVGGDGELLAVDRHVGIAGPSSARNLFHLRLERIAPSLFLRADVRLPNGASSEGEIYVDFALD
jgi:hypothetical protein